jgi:hypothetical protein
MMINRNAMLVTWIISGVLAIASTIPAVAQEQYNDADTPPLAVALPTMSSNFVEFYTRAPLTFAIDLDSITVVPSAKEETSPTEVRYILKAKSDQGAVNVNYEGIRCDTRKSMLYAVQSDKGSWVKVPSPVWSAIPISGIHLQHTFLANDYFCWGTTVSGNAQNIRDRLRWKRPLNG